MPVEHSGASTMHRSNRSKVLRCHVEGGESALLSRPPISSSTALATKVHTCYQKGAGASQGGKLHGETSQTQCGCLATSPQRHEEARGQPPSVAENMQSPLALFGHRPSNQEVTLFTSCAALLDYSASLEATQRLSVGATSAASLGGETPQKICRSLTCPCDCLRERQI